MGKPLSQSQIRNLLVRETTRPSGMPTWPKKTDRLLLAEAVKTKRKKVVFENGRVFNILYSTQSSIAWGDHGVVYISPADQGFVPCGWFHVKFLSREE